MEVKELRHFAEFVIASPALFAGRGNPANNLAVEQQMGWIASAAKSAASQ